MSRGEARQKQPSQQRIAEHGEKKRKETGQLKELKSGSFSAASANGKFWKNLQAALFAIHGISPELQEYVLGAQSVRQSLATELLNVRTVEGNWPEEGVGPRRTGQKPA